MAKTLEAFPEDAVVRGGRYPWNTWLNGQVWHLERGTKEEVENGVKDYAVSTKSFRSAVTQQRKAMVSKGKLGKVKTVVVKEGDEEVGLIIQWQPGPGDPDDE